MQEMKLYRVRLTEHYDTWADSKEAAIQTVMGELCEVLNGGSDLDYDVVVVETSPSGVKIEVPVP